MALRIACVQTPLPSGKIGPVVKHSREPENHHIHGQLHVCCFSDALILNSEKRKSTEIFVTNGSLAVLKSFRLQRGQRKTVSTITESEIKSCHKHLQKHKTTGNSLGPGSAGKEEGRKKRSNRKISASDASRVVDWGGGNWRFFLLFPPIWSLVPG